MKKTALILALLLLFSLPAGAMTMAELEQSPFYEKSPSAFLSEFMAQYGLDESNFSMAYYNTQNGELIAFNEDKLMLAGSTYKLPLNMLYCDLLKSGELTEDAVITATLTKTLEEGETLPEGAELVTDTSPTPSAAPTSETAASPSPSPQKYKISKSGVLSELMHKSLVDSDNDAAEILLRDAYQGKGYDNYLTRIEKYGGLSGTAFSFNNYDRQTLYDNYFPARYMIGCLQYLYSHAEDYALIIDDLKKAMPGAYFKRYINVEVAHKYGHFQSAYNDVGIIYSETPFLLVCYTDGLANGESITGRLAELMANYTDYRRWYDELTAAADPAEQTQSGEESAPPSESEVIEALIAEIQAMESAAVTVVEPGAVTPEPTPEATESVPLEPLVIQTEPPAEKTLSLDPAVIICIVVMAAGLALIIAMIAGSVKRSRNRKRRGGKHLARR